MATSTQVRRFKQVLGNLGCMVLLFSFLCPCGATDYCKGKFEKCICDDDSVVCHSEEKLVDNLYNLYPYIKDNVSSIIITGSNFPNMSHNFFGSCAGASDLVLKRLNYLDLSNNKIERVRGKSLHCMPNLDTLDLSNNRWAIDLNDKQIGYFTSLPNLRILNLTNTFEDVSDGTIHFYKLAHIFNATDMSKLEELRLAENEFVVLSKSAANTLCQLTSLKHLNLSHNYFIDPSMPTQPNCFANLEVLDLSSNYIAYLSTEFMQEMDVVYTKYNNLESVLLANNTFNCDCELLETWRWLNTTKVPITDKHALKCKSGYHSSYVGRPILELTPDDLLCNPMESPNKGTSAGIVVLILIFVIIGVSVVGFLVVNRTQVRYCVKNWKKKMPKMHFQSHHGYSSVQEVATI